MRLIEARHAPIYTIVDERLLRTQEDPELTLPEENGCLSSGELELGIEKRGRKDIRNRNPHMCSGYCTETSSEITLIPYGLKNEYQGFSMKIVPTTR